MPNSYKPEFRVAGDPKWYSNAVRFATRAEAQENADQKFAVWTLAVDRRVGESDDPVNYAMVDGLLVNIEPPKEKEG